MSPYCLCDPADYPVTSPVPTVTTRRACRRPTPRQRAFAAEYARCGDAGEAYRRAFPPPSGGRGEGRGRGRLADARADAYGRRMLAAPGVAELAARLAKPQPTLRGLFDELGRPWFRRRSDSHRSRYRYVRKVKGRGAFQARVPLGADPAAGRTKGDSVNLGLFTLTEHGEHAEWAAGRAAKEFVKRHRPYLPGGDLCSVLESLKRDRLIPDGVRPPGVYEVAGGYAARRKRGGQVVSLPGPYPTAAEAYRAITGVPVLRPAAVG